MKPIFNVLKKVDSFLKKAFIVFVVFFAIIYLFSYFISKSIPKQSKDPIKESRTEIYRVINDPKLKSTEEGKMQIIVYRSALCKLVGEACTDNPEDGNNNFDKSLFGFATNLIVMPFANPASSGVYWVRDGLQNAGFIPKTYAAQGIGYNALAPFKNLWLMFRNFVMMIMVLIIVAIGFMIMFRMKLNPQTVISVESALPKIVIALILITFSYPIVGFLIDLTYVVIGFVIVLFTSDPKFGFNPTELFNKYFFGGWGTLWNDFTPFDGNRIKTLFTASNALYMALPGALKTGLNVITVALGEKVAVLLLGTKIPALNILRLTQKGTEDLGRSGQPIVSAISIIVAFIITYVLGDLFGHVLAVGLLMFILTLSLFFIFFRIFFMILSSYINILFMLIFSPLIIAIDAIPGKSTFSAWLKNLIMHLMTFPIVIMLVLIVQIILNTQTNGSTLWRPPYFFGFDPDAFKAIVAMGMLFMIPDFVKAFRELLGMKPFPISFGIGSLFTGAQAIGGGGMGIMGQISSFSLAANAFRSGGFFGDIIRGKQAPVDPKAIAAEAARQALQSSRQQPDTDPESQAH